jgi:hypothetical protein
MINQSNVYSKLRLAKELGVCVRTIDKWMASGIISYSKVGRRVFFHPKDVESMLSSYRRKSFREIDDDNYDFIKARYKTQPKNNIK